jgi:hypothetical protein
VPAEIRQDPTLTGREGPLSSDQAVPTLIMAAVAMIGGALSFYRKWKEGKVRAFNITEFVGEIVVSGVCGVVGYWVLKGFDVNPYLTAAGVAIIGHMGTRAIFIAEQFIEKVVDRKATG